MVGLNDFGEGAWACEQLYNSQLAEMRQRPTSPASLQPRSAGLPRAWRAQIGGARPGMSASAAPLRASADALRLNGELLPLGAAAALDVTRKLCPRLRSLPKLPPLRPLPSLSPRSSKSMLPRRRWPPSSCSTSQPEAPVAELPDSLPEIELESFDGIG